MGSIGSIYWIYSIYQNINIPKKLVFSLGSNKIVMGNLPVYMIFILSLGILIP